ncbi:A/G-specific adenine glycosylase [Deinococcus maricopensis]|uniref:Adenine DNA glycosylase n=1 Tax=Deinococcus maricopensis (strain DSM 21211 / LMG 22137 / NRRL B-23946 / LB-34) TaxID=709986 RepID=E8U4Z6_DEIML|nr:A/G-specific adenine glycosylase [Deinococcus maricopensis]ADV66135.1 A/G-specific adenine glycosylase [Deinococcus maricopensis DSM 21211]
MPDTKDLQQALLGWFDAHARTLPWRAGAEGARDPYRVWVSEVLLQQTQVARGLVYFERFLAAFPTVQALADAPEADVLKAWEGCGYYARARNLHRAAKRVAAQGFPASYDAWRALPGVGPYTAAAVSSLTLNEPRAVMDGNVRRVMARLHAERTPTDAWAQARADELLDHARPGAWNEAVMDLGATVCIPKAPRCGACPVSAHCAAFASGQPAQYPAPKVRAEARAVQAVAVLIGDAQRAYLEVRSGRLLGGLMGLPMQEADGGDVPGALAALLARLGARDPRPLGVVTHGMTHRHLTVHVYAAHAPHALTDTGAAALARLDQKLLALAEPTQGTLFT